VGQGGGQWLIVRETAQPSPSVPPCGERLRNEHIGLVADGSRPGALFALALRCERKHEHVDAREDS